MRLIQLQGTGSYNRAHAPRQMNAGYSRFIQTADVHEMNGGYSRFVHTSNDPPVGMEGVILNGVMIQGIAEMSDVEFEEFYHGLDNPENLQGLKSLFKRARERARARRGRKSDKKEGRAEKKRLRRDKLKARTERIRAKIGKPGIFENLTEAVKGALLPGDMDSDEIFEDVVDIAGSEEQRGLFKPKFGSKRWFNNLSTIQKVALIGGGLIAVDFATGGNIILKRVGVMKGKKRR